jgi:hypothetical protein
MKLTTYLFFLFLLSISCQDPSLQNPLETVLQSTAPEIKRVMLDVEKYEVQILYSEIKKNNGSVTFTDYEFKVNDSIYFYPASTVKLPVSVLTLEKLSSLNFPTLDTPFFVEGEDTITTFKQNITNIFAVSSNDTYNRLFDYLGKDAINNSLKKKGVKARISHRLSTTNADDLVTRPLVFYRNDSLLTQTTPTTNKPITPLKLLKIKKGNSFYSDDVLIEEPMDFSFKNYLPITSLHNIIKRIIFPEAFSKEEQFNLTKEHRLFLLNAMSILPKEAGYEQNQAYYDSYGKFFMFGDSKDPIPNHIKIYNKVGYAYGYLTDSAYIRDTKNNIEFILTATIHVNKDGVFNNNVYEYNSIGIPFLAQLGRELYQLQLAKY